MGEGGENMFWKILLAHLLADFVFQTDWINHRKNKPMVLVLHGGIFLGLAALFLASSLSWGFFAGLALVAALHILIDYCKKRFQKKYQSRQATLFLVDQGLHLGIILGFLVVFDNSGLIDLLQRMEGVVPEADIFLLVSLPIMIILGGGYFTGAVCRGFMTQLNNKERPGIDKAGRYIGILERSLVLAAVLVGKFEIIGFLLAAKSIVRYPEIKGDDRGETFFAEYFLVGTLTSLSWAFFGSLLLHRLVDF